MNKYFKSRVLLTLLLVVTTFFSVTAQKINLDNPIPVDPNVTIGTLPNGLTYYIKHNDKPEDKIELRLVVNAGSILENDDQLGLAHFMEHMNFNGLENFPKNALVEYLQDIGVKFGADLNANTGFERTYFILPIPTDNPDNVNQGFQIIADWAGGALITDEEVNDERKVILEELRLHQESAGNRMMKQFLPGMLNDSRFADRLPIGTKESIENATPELLRQYYNDWYRPNNMAVVVVGDITTEKAEELIKKYFSGLKNPKNEKERVYYKIKPYAQAKAMIVTDPEATNYDLSILFPSKERKEEKTLGDYRHSLVRSIFTQSINLKLHKLAQSGNPPYARAYASLGGAFGSFTLKNEGFNLDVMPINNFKTAIDSAVAEIIRIRDFGFSENDIENTKKRILASYEKSFKERDKTLSSDLVGEYTRNFMRQEPIPGIANEYKYAQEMFPTITSEEVSKLANEILSDYKNFFALITGPEKGDIDLPSEEELLNMVKSAFQQKVTKEADTEAASTLLTSSPTPGKIVSQKEDKELGTTTYTLSNGVTVTVKSTDFKSDEIIFTGTKFGGTGQFDLADKSNANFLTTVIGSMGYGEFSPTDLRDFLSGQTVSLSPEMGELSNNVGGASSVKDFETLLQLNYLELTSPRLDTALYHGFLTKQKTQLKFLTANPQVAFIDTLTKTMYDNNPLAPIAIPNEKDIDNIDVNRVMEIYKNQFGNADGFHFFIVGNVDQSSLKPLMEKYLASLPTKGEKPNYKDNGVRLAKGDKVLKFYKGANDKSLIINVFHGEGIKYSQELALKADLLGQIMTMQINDTIREKMQVIYSGAAMAQIEKLPYPRYSIIMQLPTGPESVDIILKELDKEIKGYKADGGPKGSLKKAVKATLEGRKEELKKNDFWAQHLEDIMVWGDSKDFFLNYEKNVKGVTEKDIIEVANQFLGGNQLTAISFPEKGK